MYLIDQVVDVMLQVKPLGVTHVNIVVAHARITVHLFEFDVLHLLNHWRQNRQPVPNTFGRED